MAGDEKSTSVPSWAAQSRVTNAILAAPMVLSNGLTPVWFWLNRSWGQFTVPPAHAAVPLDPRTAVVTMRMANPTVLRRIAVPFPDGRAGPQSPAPPDTSGGGQWIPLAPQRHTLHPESPR